MTAEQREALRMLAESENALYWQPAHLRGDVRALLADRDAAVAALERLTGALSDIALGTAGDRLQMMTRASEAIRLPPAAANEIGGDE